MKKKVLLLVSMLVVISMFLTACAGGAPKSNDTPQAEAKKETKSEGKSEPVVLKFAQTNNEKHKYHKGLEKFKELIEAKSNGRYKLDLYAGTLGGDRELIEALQLGTADAGAINTSVITSIVPELGVIDLPFLFKDRDHAYRVLDGEIGQGLKEAIGKKVGIVPAHYWENGFRGFTNDKKPISKPEDLKDLKMRVMQVAMYLDTFKAWGANPTPMAWSEVYPAMQQGVIDGHDNAADTVSANRLWEVQEYFTDSQHFYTTVLFAFSPKFYNELSDEDKKLFMEVSEEVKKYERELAAKMFDEGLETLRKNMTVIEKRDVDFDAFKESVKPIWEKHYDVYGKELIEKIANY